MFGKGGKEPGFVRGGGSGSEFLEGKLVMFTGGKNFFSMFGEGGESRERSSRYDEEVYGKILEIRRSIVRTTAGLPRKNPSAYSREEMKGVQQGREYSNNNVNKKT